MTFQGTLAVREWVWTSPWPADLRAGKCRAAVLDELRCQTRIFRHWVVALSCFADLTCCNRGCRRKTSFCEVCPDQIVSLRLVRGVTASFTALRTLRCAMTLQLRLIHRSSRQVIGQDYEGLRWLPACRSRFGCDHPISDRSRLCGMTDAGSACFHAWFELRCQNLTEIPQVWFVRVGQRLFSLAVALPKKSAVRVLREFNGYRRLYSGPAPFTIVITLVKHQKLTSCGTETSQPGSADWAAQRFHCCFAMSDASI